MQKVGKLNSSIDIIPLRRSSDDLKSKSMNNKHKINSTHKHFRDQLLISRVQTYMQENETKIYLDVTGIADSLQKKYRDYRIKKQGPFRALVRKAYDELTEMFSDKYAREWPVYDEDDDEEGDVESDSQNTIMDNMLLKMYKKSQNKQNGNSSDKELMDISSNDDASKIESSSTKTSELKIMAKNSQQKPGPSSSIEKPVPTKKIEQLVTTTPGKEVQEIKTVESTSTVTNKPVLKQIVKKRKREKGADVGNQLPMKKAKRLPVLDSKVTFADIVGNDDVLETVHRLIMHMKHPKISKRLQTTPPRGILLHGPTGCGKTLLAHAIAGELELPLLEVASAELVEGISGESESQIRQLFEQALAIAPCVMLLDEIDAIAQHKSTAQRGMERRMVSQLLSCLDDLNSKENGARVLVLGATNRPDSLDAALRTHGRFDREICLGIPDTKAREKILAIHTKKVPLAPNISLSKIASLTPGFVGGDLVALISEAAMVTLDRLAEDLESVSNNKSPETEIVIKNEEENFKNTGNLVEEAKIELSTSNQTDVSTLNKTQTTENNNQENSESTILTRLNTLLHAADTSLSSELLSNLYIELSDLETALRVVQPSAKREGFVTVPDVTWDDIGSLQDIKEELKMLILARVRHPEICKEFGLTAPTGVLLCGPPGCGKTLLAKAVANEADINFISVKGSELLDKYVGESEKAVRQYFLRAKNAAPCVIFFDEIEALCPKRSGVDNTVMSRVVSQMLTEMDGLERRKGIFLVGCSNYPDVIHQAVLRPGRLGKILYVGLPTSADRVDILRTLTKTTPKLAADVDLEEIGYKCDGYTGADLAALLIEAGSEAFKEHANINYTGQRKICARHFSAAFNKIRPSVNKEDIKHYEKLKKLYSMKKKFDDTPMETSVDTPIVNMVMKQKNPRHRRNRAHQRRLKLLKNLSQ